MAHIQQDELRRLARAARLSFNEAQEPAIIQNLDAVLTYVDRLQEVKGAADAPGGGSMPDLVVRPDQVQPADSARLRAEAPVEEAGFFVVPAILVHEK